MSKSWQPKELYLCTWVCWWWNILLDVPVGCSSPLFYKDLRSLGFLVKGIHGDAPEQALCDIFSLNVSIDIYF